MSRFIKILVPILVVLGVFLVTIKITLADDTPAPQPSPTPKRMIYKKSERHEFSGAKLKGQLKKPDLSYIYERKGLRAEQIVNIPDNFNAEIIRGAAQF